ncbi:MAG: Rho termination factor N-terminal domain-containing protein [Acidimicrobiia bacterium]|nr:Rho termination factor N-terminal domain-containing protein [Acidimicrobiia bacterium]
MGRSEEFRGRVRRAARATLDQASAAVDRVATVVRDRLAKRGSANVAPPASVETVPPARPTDRASSSVSSPDLQKVPDLTELTKAQLYRLAQEHDIAGRSKLSKDELVAALQATDH